MSSIENGIEQVDALTKLQSLAEGVGMPRCANLASSENGSKGSFATTCPLYLHQQQCPTLRHSQAPATFLLSYSL